jgi:hypothetical protein
MSDEPIVEYLRSRAQVRPPMDLVGSIADAVQGIPQQRHSWFAPFMPAAGAVAAAAVVAVAAVLLGQAPDAGPPPGGSPFETAPPTPTVTPSPSMPALIRPDDSATIRATDSGGTWGILSLTRGADVGGYDDGSVPPDSFVIEVHVEYVAERQPDPATFGAPDWRLTAGTNRLPIGYVLEPDGRVERARPSLAEYPGAIDIFTTPLEGWLLFVVPREAAAETLELVYQPEGLDEPVAVFLLRMPEAAPDPVAAAAPGPTPAPVTYVEKDGYPFTVIDHAEADELFATPDTCTNPEAGYTVTYPDAWFTNTEIGDWPACSWFSPTFFDVGDDPNEVPPQVAIVLTIFDGGMGQIGPYDTTVDEIVLVDGFDARRREQIGQETPAEGYQAHPPFYRYEVIVAPQPAVAPTLTANTNFEGAADYELNKAVLDRIMALIEFDE